MAKSIGKVIVVLLVVVFCCQAVQNTVREKKKAHSAKTKDLGDISSATGGHKIPTTTCISFQ